MPIDLKFMNWWIKDFLSDTTDMDAEESGAYMMLIGHCFLEGYIPKDRRKLLRISRLYDIEKTPILDRIIEKYFHVNGSGYVNNRASEERADAIARIEKAVRAGKVGALARWGPKGDAPTGKHKFKDDIEKPEPVKRKPKPKKKQPETPADLPVTASKTPTLYKSIEQAFLSKVGKFTNYEKEGKAIKGLIEKAENWQPESPAQFIQTIIETYFKMRQDEAFFGKQPFLPSALNSSGIFDRVMVKFEDKSQQIPEELKHLYEGVI